MPHTAGDPATSDEADAVAYFAMHAFRRNTIPRHVVRVADALAGGAPVLRTQRGPSLRDLIAAAGNNCVDTGAPSDEE